jgi:hypothetical protein
MTMKNILPTLFLLIFACYAKAQTSQNFNDSITFLDKYLTKQIKLNVVRNNDTNAIYVGDEKQMQLYYQALIPQNAIKGTIVLMPGTWETTAHVWNSMAEFCSIANKNNLAVLVYSINQRLTLTNEIIQTINLMSEQAIQTYHLPKDKFVFGGFSMGGIFSLRYAELAVQDSSIANVKPKAVFSCDGPCDLKHVYANFQRKKDKNPGLNEPKYGIAELEKYCEGTPATNAALYEYFSPFTFDAPKGGNAQFLLKMPVRIYGDVDPVWWMQNRHVDMYDLNALDQTALIQLLNDMGNNKAEFINSFQKGMRIEGNRHPHSWSIVDPQTTINWIISNLK